MPTVPRDRIRPTEPNGRIALIGPIAPIDPIGRTAPSGRNVRIAPALVANQP
jgi:hypothetical protein